MPPASNNSFFLVAYFVLLSRLALVQASGSSTPAQAHTSTVSCDRYHHTGFWTIDIDNFADLPPECGPPISFYAIRDKAQLPKEICIVVGAYLFFVLALGTLLLTWGRRLRQSALGSNGTLEIEMVSSPHKRFEPSPSSPGSASRSWIKKGVSSLRSMGSSSDRTSRAGSNPASPGMASVNSFDGNVLADDRDKAQKEMERLYAAVMAHDEAKRQAQVHDGEVPPQSDMPRNGHKKPGMRLQTSDPRLIIPGPPTGASQISEPTSPRSPVRAIYPPDHNWPQNYPITPTSPIVARLPLEHDMYPASPPPKSPPRMTFAGSDLQQPSSPRSILRRKERPGSQGTASVKSSGSKTRRSVRNMRISAPVPQNEQDIEERQPLTPRQYPDPGKAPQPPTPHTGATTGTQDSTGTDYHYESLDQPAPLPLPQAQPQRRPQNLALVTSNGANLPSTTTSNGKLPSTTASTANTLPLRAFQNQSVTSPGPMKTTHLERRHDALARGPLTGRTPRTGACQTPYTPYMPFTPITPVTPHLVSKRERKERMKQAGKTVIVEEDAVKDQDEMWDM